MATAVQVANRTSRAGGGTLWGSSAGPEAIRPGDESALRTQVGIAFATEGGFTDERALGACRPTRDPLTAVVVSAAPILLESRYRLLIGACVDLRRSRRGRWLLGAVTGAVTLVLAALAARHFAAMSWPLSTRHPGLLVAAGFLLVLAQALKAVGWGRLFAAAERPAALALAAGNGGAALVGVLLPGRFDDAMRVAVVRRYPGCPAGVRVLCLSLVMLGLIDSVALAPLALAGAVLPNAGDRHAGRARARRSRRRRSRDPHLEVAAPRGEPARRALSPGSLGEHAHDVAAAGVRGVGIRVGVLARPRRRVLPPPRERSVSATRCRSRCSSSAPAQLQQHFQSAWRGRPRRWGPEARRS